MDLIEKNISNRSVHRHPWELSRAFCVLNFLDKKTPKNCFADIGSGDQFFTKKLSSITKKPVFAVDINYKKNRTKKKIVELKNVAELPFSDINYFILMDVLEHIEDDFEFMKTLAQKSASSKFIITVPANQFLFSNHDRSLNHYRRYSKKRLREIAKKCDLEVNELFYFYSNLFMLRIFGLIANKLGINKFEPTKIAKWNYGQKHFITRAIVHLMNFDFKINRTLNRMKINLPGLSLILICEKR